VHIANTEGKRITFQDLAKEKLREMHQLKKLIPSLTQLRKGNYIEGPDSDLQVTSEGIEVIESLFSKFLNYLKLHQSEDDLSYWTGALGYYKNTKRELIEQTYFHLKDNSLRSAFNAYLNEIGSIRNIISFEIKEQDLGVMVDDIFIHLDEVNKLSQFKFKCKLFCPPVAACAMMSRAVRINEPNITSLVTVIGNVLNSICQTEIEKLSPVVSGFDGSINKIKAFLDNKAIVYTMKTIDTLRLKCKVRSSSVHETGSDIVQAWKELNITIDTEDYIKALRLLKSLNDCLVDMKSWFS
jgi:hypothetical protein